VDHSLSVIFLHPVVATLFAFGGIALGLVLRKIALHRLSLLVAAAMGTLLAVTLFDVLPDAKQFLTWPTLLLACASGYLLLWAIGKYVYHVCPACAVNDLEDANPHLARTAMMLMVALGLHCTMDGLGIAFGDSLLGHPDIGLVTGISVHKIPEGLALILLLLGAGIERKKAMRWALGVESMTIFGGVIGFYLPSEFHLDILVRNIVRTCWRRVLLHDRQRHQRYTRPACGEPSLRSARVGQ
jgi:zinc transporter ZupT